MGEPTLVIDASVVVAALLNHHADARQALAHRGVLVPHLIDAEVAHVCRRRVLAGTTRPDVARRVLRRWVQWPAIRIAHQPLVDRAWSLRDNVSAYDAMYVALAERLDATLVTLDQRLATAPHGVRVMLLARH
jgi:predicted nucleic acid-binding protein